MSIKDWNKIYKNVCRDYDKLPDILPPVNRIIVIGDLHGDWEMTIKSLKIPKLINDRLEWIGGDTVVVQLGDQIDRCRAIGIPCHFPNATKDDEASDIKILNFFSDLHKQAQKYGGSVYSIIGNHEVMNVMGDMRYVSYENIKDFDNYKKPNNSSFNSGMEARKWAFAQGNPIANFLGCTRKMALIIGSNLFVHAGILPNIAKKYNISEMNKIMSLYLWNKLKNPNNYRDLLILADSSPLWVRNHHYFLDNDDNCHSLLDPLKDIYKVDKLFIGHTPQILTGINKKCKDKIWLTDYGASKAFDPIDININTNNVRSKIREAHVLEILEDGKIINILH